ncbi:hypothetical protein FE392_06060 [Xenorhabdus sp. 12]|uniref:Uncharacterized protein n=2 Tax=Xenorhabdus santafensis TaxID=2582833 RepID=A0ABU4S7Z1_9GAMM|nr:hypothetical protein [Xenorhabdus sp. 12]
MPGFAVTTLRLSHNQNHSYALHKNLIQFANEVKEKIDREIHIRIYPDAQPGNQRESLKLMLSGSLDSVKSNTAELELAISLTSMRCS